MVNTVSIPIEFLARVPLFAGLSQSALLQLSEGLRPSRYAMGQVILERDRAPEGIIILFEGRFRLLGYDARCGQTIPLETLEAGDTIGWLSLLRGVACESAIASADSVGLFLPARTFQTLQHREPEWAATLQQRSNIVEVCEILGAELARTADGETDLRSLALQAAPHARIHYYTPHSDSLDSNFLWWMSSGSIPEDARLQRFDPALPPVVPPQKTPLRLLGLPRFLLEGEGERGREGAGEQGRGQWEDLEIPLAAPLETLSPEQRRDRYPYIYGKGKRDAPLACFEMLARYFGTSYRPDTLRRVIVQQLQQRERVTLETCAAIADWLGWQPELLQLPLARLSRWPVPALIEWENSFAILYETGERDIHIARPERGIQRYSPAEMRQLFGESARILLLKAGNAPTIEQFGLSWFLPALSRYRRVLLEVFIASFFVQLLGLANPLMTQFIIDKVIGDALLDALPVLATLLIGAAVFEAILTAARTHLFADTANRIDFSLGSTIIDRLLRLPLSYFSRRSTGEVASRVQELENIRQFLTGTALTAVLDALFSIVYIIVMAIYSPILTAVALGIVPLIALLTFLVSPNLRRRLRRKAECNAQSQAYLVEVLNGMETVKAQNLEMRSRTSWQERYSRYISAGLQAIQLSTLSNALSTLLNRLSSLAVLCVGAYLVIQQQLTLGEFIAFRIIAGYVTSPLLRLSQLWQNFQETALSLERLSDILDNPGEDEGQRDNLPLPGLQGRVKYENVCFRFGNSGKLQLANINLEIPAGEFVGIVGKSGSGKSTLMKLLARLYEVSSGRILVDRYDISKVELYSLRQQIGIVPQNTLLFEGTVQENIALTNPHASFEEIVEAAEIAAAHEFIMNDLPNGYNTRVGEGGANLSGGQRQRIAIARAILQNPQLLILDEATSALDYATEWQVCQNLRAAFAKRTTFLITHRLSTIKNSDRILFVERGSVVEQGTHNELMALKGQYYCLYRQQEKDC